MEPALRRRHIYLNADFYPCFAPKNPQLRHHAVTATVPYGRDRIEIDAIFASLTRVAQQRSGSCGGIVSSFRLICTAALTAAAVGFVAGAAAAQSATDQSGKPYLAGLRPPHEQHKPAQVKTSHAGVRHKATTKSAETATKRQRIMTVRSKAHRPARLADKINSHVAWPSAEPAAADERAAPATVLQFATEDSERDTAATRRPTPPVPPTSTAKTVPPTTIAATDERNNIVPAADEPPATSTLVQTERFETPAPSQMRVIGSVPASPVAAAAPIEASLTASAGNDPSPARRNTWTAQLLATVGGAIAACVVGFVIFGFGSTRNIKSTRI